ncbi:MAG: winged helix-turn-helix transcriptional regulator [Deltaproteobacteria bacterium]|nr:winged helix-turn-helix transcriptional regulator [Deltaproteobacteria bacterium]
MSNTSILPSHGPPVGNVTKAGAITMDLEHRRVWVENRFISLAPKDFELLKVLLEAKGDTVSRYAIFEKVWGSEKSFESASRIVDAHILRLRQKLGAEGRRILTVKHVGYRFDVVREWIRFGP